MCVHNSLGGVTHTGAEWIARLLGDTAQQDTGQFPPPRDVFLLKSKAASPALGIYHWAQWKQNGIQEFTVLKDSGSFPVTEQLPADLPSWVRTDAAAGAQGVQCIGHPLPAPVLFQVCIYSSSCLHRGQGDALHCCTTTHSPKALSPTFCFVFALLIWTLQIQEGNSTQGEVLLSEPICLTGKKERLLI